MTKTDCTDASQKTSKSRTDWKKLPCIRRSTSYPNSLHRLTFSLSNYFFLMFSSLTDAKKKNPYSSPLRGFSQEQGKIHEVMLSIDIND